MPHSSYSHRFGVVASYTTKSYQSKKMIIKRKRITAAGDFFFLLGGSYESASEAVCEFERDIIFPKGR